MVLLLTLGLSTARGHRGWAPLYSWAQQTLAEMVHTAQEELAFPNTCPVTHMPSTWAGVPEDRAARTVKQSAMVDFPAWQLRAPRARVLLN